VANRLKNYAYNLFLNASQTMNTITGGDPDESISSRIGKSIKRGGLASRIPMPGFARRHFEASVELDEGGNRAGKRETRI
jgi:hypothetical protein